MIDKGVTIPMLVHGYSLSPSLQYKDQYAFEVRPMDGSLDIGAFEYATTLSAFDPVAYHINLYPNPSSGAVQVDIDFPSMKKGILQLINLSGVVVMKSTLQSGKNSINTTGLTGNVYFAVFHMDEEVVVRKIIIL